MAILAMAILAMAILAMTILAMTILAMAILAMAILTIGEMHDAAGLATLEAITRLPYHEQSGAGGAIMVRVRAS